MKLKDWNHTVTDTFVFFFGGPFSQWASCKFEVAGKEYDSTEQYMMAQKALYFKDIEAYERIMSTSNPRDQKAIGREIKGFDIPQWQMVCEDIVYTANVAKFTQNEELRQTLIESGDRIIVEASPYDKIWGIGLAEGDPRCENSNLWEGKNLLGIALMRVRETITVGR